jgi:RluA family pseudouridine synthase
MDKWIVDLEEDGKRLLTFVKDKVESSTKDVRWSIENNRCLINGRVERYSSTRLKKGDHVEVLIDKRPNFTLDKNAVLYEDGAILVYDKPPSIATTGPSSLATLLNLFPVHRLDKETSGVVLFAKDKKTQRILEDQFRKREVNKTYVALVVGIPKEKKGVIENFLGKIAEREGEVFWGELSQRHGGVPAKTKWNVEKEGPEASLLRCHPKTGRTHQLRVHLSGLGHPIVGDVRYGGRKHHLSYRAKRVLLHANTLEFHHPLTNERLFISAKLPADFEEALTQLKCEVTTE